MADLRKLRSRVSRPQRVVMLGAVAVAMAGYAIWGLANDDIILPAGRRSGGTRLPDVHFHGIWAKAMAAAFFCIVLAILVQIVQDLRTPPGGKIDQRITTALCILGFGLFVVLMVLMQFGAI